ncbi:hypothetical protein V8F20_006155 [Naviculisporaceae sp. PSN 640]
MVPSHKDFIPMGEDGWEQWLEQRRRLRRQRRELREREQQQLQEQQEQQGRSTPNPESDAKPTGTGTETQNSSEFTRDAVPYPRETFIILHKATGRPITLFQDGSLEVGPEPFDYSSPSRNYPLRDCSIHWQCVEHWNGWLGFQSTTWWPHGKGSEYPDEPRKVTWNWSVCPGLVDDVEKKNAPAPAPAGPYLGLGVRIGTIKGGYPPQPGEYFCARRPPGGGYLLSTLVQEQTGRSESMLAMWNLEAVQYRGETALMASQHGGDLWEFVKVNSRRR